MSFYYEPSEPTRGELALYERIYEEMLDETGDEPREQDVWDEVQRWISGAGAYDDRGLE